MASQRLMGWNLGSYWKNCGKYCGNDDEPCSKKVFVIQFNWGYPVNSVTYEQMGLVLNASFYWEQKNGSKKQAFIRQKSEDQKWSAAKIDRVDAQEPTSGAAIARMWVWHMFAPSKDRDKWDTWYDRDIIKVPRSKSESLGMGWVPLGTWKNWKVYRFTEKKSWAVRLDIHWWPIETSKVSRAVPLISKLQGMPLSDQVGMFIYTV